MCARARIIIAFRRITRRRVPLNEGQDYQANPKDLEPLVYDGKAI